MRTIYGVSQSGRILSSMTHARTFDLEVQELGECVAVVVVHSERDPEPNEWNAALARIAAYRASAAVGQRWRHLVLSDGGAPNVWQTLQMVKTAWASSPGKTAVFSHLLWSPEPGPAARETSRALSIMNPFLRFFAAQDLSKALGYLDLMGQEQAIRSTLERVAQRIGGSRALSQL